MRKLRAGVLLVFGLMIFLQVGLRWTDGCSINPMGACFWFSSRAAMDLEVFSRGELGIIQPTWARSYLVAAFLTLERGPLNESARDQMLSLWRYRLDDLDSEEFPVSRAPSRSVETWLQARNLAAPVCPGLKARLNAIPVDREPVGGPAWRAYRNCGDDAFVNAVRVLISLDPRWDSAPREVCSWIAAQDQVFANCGGGPPVIPEMKEDLDPEMARLRAYQIAAAHFYAEQWDEAAGLFREIGRDQESPWKDIAPHLVVRCLLRKAQIRTEGGDRSLWNEARVELESLLADPVRAGRTARAQRFLLFLEMRLLPADATAELGRRILDQPLKSPRLARLVNEYSLLLKSPDDFPDYTIAPGQDPASAPEDPLTRWIRMIQSAGGNPDSRMENRRVEAVARWRRSGSKTWLIAAMMNSGSRDADTRELVQAAAGVPITDPAGPTLMAERLRLRSSDPDVRRAAREIVNDVSVSWEVRNFLASRLLETATDFEETAQLMSRKVVCELPERESLLNFQLPCAGSEDSWYRDRPRPDYILDCVGARLVNFGLPLESLEELVGRPDIKASVRTEIGRAAWTRAVLLGDHLHGVSIAGLLAPLDPELARPLRRYIGESTDGKRAHTALDILLWFPDLAAQVPGCDAPSESGRRETPSYRAYWSNSWFDPWPAVDFQVEPEPPLWLDSDHVPVLRQELKDLTKPTSNIEVYLCRKTIEWAEEEPEDPRVPPALHRAIRATRYARRTEDVGECSRRAFRILHGRYPKSSWAKKTPYWYAGR